jgi:phosphomethylpyrimidine synthase
LLYADDAGRRDPPSILIAEERSVSKDEAESGMAAMSEKFNAMGQQVYIDAAKVKESNKVL